MTFGVNCHRLYDLTTIPVVGIVLMRSVQKAASFIAQWEGFRADPYFDLAGILTVGYGFTESLPFWDSIATRVPLSEDDGMMFLERAILEVYAPPVVARMKLEAAPWFKQAGWVSFAYNVGTQAATTSTAARFMAGGREEAAEEELGRWVYADGQVIDGLVARRRAERALIEKDEAHAHALRRAVEPVATRNVIPIPLSSAFDHAKRIESLAT